MADTDASIDKEFQAFRTEVHGAADQLQAQGKELVAAETAAGKQELDLAKDFTSTQQLFTAEPPHDQISNIMAGAPWLMALMALGGKASGANGLAMMQGLNGMSDGLIKGDEQALENNYKRYNAAFDKWKVNSDNQFRIYNTLAQAYSHVNDGKLRAMTAALDITGDATKMKLQVDDPAKLIEMKARVEEAHARTQEAYAKIKQIKESSGAGFNDPRVQQLQAAIAEKGATLPAGLKSRAQQLAVFQGLLARHPDMTPDEIADLIKTGKADMAALMKEATTAAGVAGRVAVAGNEIQEFVPLVREAMNKVPRTSFMPINRLLQTQESQLADPNLRALKIRINSLLNAYDLLAARGGTDVAKRAEAHALLESADSPEVLESALQSFTLEAQAAARAAQKAEHPGDTVGGTPGATVAPQTAKHAIGIGRSQSDPRAFIKYSDGSVEPIGP